MFVRGFKGGLEGLHYRLMKISKVCLEKVEDRSCGASIVRSFNIVGKD